MVNTLPTVDPGDGAGPHPAGPFDAATELGRSYLKVDWAATPLGSLEGWSDSLKSVVRMMLASRFSMWMGWGPQLTFFCNEAYRRDTLADKFPWALGRPTGEVWSEIWDQLTERVAAVTGAGESTWDEELKLFVQRSGYLEETYHTFSYSPLTEGDATISGLLCVVNEVTEGVVSARRIATVGNLSAGLAAAATQQHVFDAARTGVSRNAVDFPFAAAYLIDDDGQSARLAWSAGIEPGRPATPMRIDRGERDALWWSRLPSQGRTAADEAFGAGEVDGSVDAGPDVVVINDVGSLFDEVRSEQGVAPSCAVLTPITQAGVDALVGFLVIAPSPHRPLDREYLDYIQLIGEQFEAALTRARGFESERDQANLVAAREHAIARELQSSLLPTREFDTDHLDVATFYRAGVEGTEVGGDWYDVIDLGPGRTALVIGDVMGRGVQAAAVMGQLRASVRAYARLELAPDVVLGLLDETVRELGGNKIVTCIYAIYDPTDHTLTYANAGHLPALVTVPGQPTRALPGGGLPLGTGRGWPESHTVTLPIGSTLTLFTDGLVERRGTDIDDGITRVKQLLEASSEHIDSVPDRLVTDLMPDGPDDDIAILIAQVSQRAHLDHTASLPLDHDTPYVSLARHFLTATLRDWYVDDDTIFDAQLVISELVTNAFVHARTDGLLTVRTTGQRLFLEVHDNAATAPRPRDALPSDTNGRGLAIVAALAHRWGTRQTKTGKAVWCELSLPHPSDADTQHR